MRTRPMTNVRETFPRTRSRRELEKTINAMQAGSMQKKVAAAYWRKPILVRPKA